MFYIGLYTAELGIVKQGHPIKKCCAAFEKMINDLLIQQAIAKADLLRIENEINKKSWRKDRTAAAMRSFCFALSPILIIFRGIYHFSRSYGILVKKGRADGQSPPGKGMG